MICYKDMTFCEFDDCKQWDRCDRALTATVQQAAQKWWGQLSDAPVSLFMDKPECYKKRKERRNEISSR